jgi:hypothetical protein
MSPEFLRARFDGTQASQGHLDDRMTTDVQSRHQITIPEIRLERKRKRLSEKNRDEAYVATRTTGVSVPIFLRVVKSGDIARIG